MSASTKCSQSPPSSPTACFDQVVRELRRAANGMLLVPPVAEFAGLWTRYNRRTLEDGSPYKEFLDFFAMVWNSRTSSDRDRVTLAVAERHGVTLWISLGKLEIHEGTASEAAKLQELRMDGPRAAIHELLAGPAAALS